MAVGLHQQQRLAIQRQADFGVVLDATDGRAVQKLQRAGDDLRGDDVGHRLRGLVHLREGGHHGALGRRLGDQLEQNLGDHAQRAFRADEQVLERIAGDVLDALVAGPEHFAVRQHHLQAHDVVAGDAVFEAAQAAGVFRHVAADGGDLHRARVGRIEQARRRRGIGDCLRGDAGLGQQGEVGAVQFQDAVHLHQAEHDAIRAGQAAAAQAGAGAAGDDGGFGLIGEFEHANGLLGGVGESHTAWHLLQRRGAVKGVRNQIFLRGQDICGAEEASKFRSYILRK